MRIFPAVSLLACALLCACSPLGLAGGAAVGTGMAASREGGISGTLTDTRIHAEIADLWFKYDLGTFAKLGITVNQGRVLLTGIVQKPEHRVEAVRLAWQVKGVKQVINEIRIADSEGIPGYLRDKWISTRLRAEMTFDDIIENLNYSIDTVQGTVYIMGTAQSQAELDRVVSLARTIPDVRRVVSYIKLAHEMAQAGSQMDQAGRDGPQENQAIPQNAQPVNRSMNRNDPHGNAALRPEESWVMPPASGPAIPLSGTPGRPGAVTSEPLR